MEVGLRILARPRRSFALHPAFTDLDVPAVTVYGVAIRLDARARTAASAMQQADWEIASHGYKWVEYKDMCRPKKSAYRSRRSAHTLAIGESFPDRLVHRLPPVNTVVTLPPRKVV